MNVYAVTIDTSTEWNGETVSIHATKELAVAWLREVARRFGWPVVDGPEATDEHQLAYAYDPEMTDEGDDGHWWAAWVTRQPVEGYADPPQVMVVSELQDRLERAGSAIRELMESNDLRLELARQRTAADGAHDVLEAVLEGRRLSGKLEGVYMSLDYLLELQRELSSE